MSSSSSRPRAGWRGVAVPAGVLAGAAAVPAAAWSCGDASTDAPRATVPEGGMPTGVAGEVDCSYTGGERVICQIPSTCCITTATNHYCADGTCPAQETELACDGPEDCGGRPCCIGAGGDLNAECAAGSTCSNDQPTCKSSAECPSAKPCCYPLEADAYFLAFCTALEGGCVN